MDDNQDFDEKSPDLYEEVLVSESLDQYEGLLNRSKSTKEYLKNIHQILSLNHIKTKY
ncbi:MULTISPECIES: hypothetical protein [unclassified Prochlorococcus]|uniref:hypothetical protein n=1 Tax=unclassified Prochlorococcus TaxID=2627481 RepID=UPI0005338348|nr:MULTISPECIES: hypothetical protein [unclassified Prochlorococcus]KGG14818.1 hypothetical protein EV06_1881 [Prochlorococcus sp. MIT 0602]KGG15749.1 hypothetical protein EV07_1714 [Prochlorococcus sp. MIT 0603]